MSNTLPPHSILSKLEENKCNKLQADLTILTSRHEQLMAELKIAEDRLKEIGNRRHNLLKCNIMASELTALAAAHREELARKEHLAVQLNELSDVEKVLRAEVFACMSKLNAYGALRDKEEKRQERSSSRAEQQMVDDLMASRCIRGC
jgi:flagellar biosynthesis chaperone FliJ